MAIARTLPAYQAQSQVSEVRQLYQDSIAAACRFIYIENQYLSAHGIGEALAARLREEDGPEVVIVMPEKTGGWLEQHTMDVLRGRRGGASAGRPTPTTACASTTPGLPKIPTRL